MTDLVSRLLEAIEEAERLASFREELPGMDFGITDSKSWHTKGCGYRQSEWMEACDCDVPSSVLRRCAADRRLIAIHEKGENAIGEVLCRRCEVRTNDGDADGEWPCETLLTLTEGYGLSGHQEGNNG